MYNWLSGLTMSYSKIRVLILINISFIITLEVIGFFFQISKLNLKSQAVSTQGLTTSYKEILK